MDKVILLAAAIITDQLSKYLALLLLPPGESFSFMGNILELTFVFNPDGFLSMARGLPGPVRFFLLNICVGGLLAVTLYYLFFYGGRKKHYELPLLMVTAGGLSNLLDRVIHAEGVIDFVRVCFGVYRTGIFNLADVYILAGSFIIGYRWGIKR